MQRSAAQRHRLNRAANFAQSHLADALDLHQLAEVACLSKYHFARTFSAHYKETPIQFVWRNRVEHAARALVLRREKAITEIAMDLGFSSSQTFSRAVSQRFRMAPRILRSRGLAHIPNISPAHSAKLSRLKLLNDRWERFSVRIERRPQVRVAYIRHIGPYWNVDGGITKCFEALERWARPRGLWIAGSELIGNCPNNDDADTGTPLHLRCLHSHSARFHRGRCCEHSNSPGGNLCRAEGRGHQ